MKLINQILVLALVTGLTGCGAKISARANNSSSSVMETMDFPAVVEIWADTHYCSGTFISKRAILTAAHCLTMDGNYTVRTSFGQFQTDLKATLGDGSNTDTLDIGLLYFDHDVALEADQVMKLGTSVSVGDYVTLVGFGCNNLMTEAGGDTKRVGWNRVVAIDGFVEVAAPSTTTRMLLGNSDLAVTCPGDSGGPLAIRGPQGDLQLVGVVHGGGTDSTNTYSFFVNATEATVRNFIDSINTAQRLGI